MFVSVSAGRDKGMPPVTLVDEVLQALTSRHRASKETSKDKERLIFIRIGSPIIRQNQSFGQSKILGLSPPFAPHGAPSDVLTGIRTRRMDTLDTTV